MDDPGNVQEPGDRLDLAAIRERLASARGQEYWRSLEELAGTEEFQALLHREFPENASDWMDSVSRRGLPTGVAPDAASST